MTREVEVKFRGEMRTYKEIGGILHMSASRIRARHAAGIPLDAPSQRVVRGVGEVADRRRISGINVTNDRLPYEQDVQAQAVNQYFLAREPLHSVQEIAELMDCDLEDALLYRDELRNLLFPRQPTLQLVGDVLGVSRERVRQLEERAYKRARAKPQNWPILASMRDDVSELESSRRPHPSDNPTLGGAHYIVAPTALPHKQARRAS